MKYCNYFVVNQAQRPCLMNVNKASLVIGHEALWSVWVSTLTMASVILDSLDYLKSSPAVGSLDWPSYTRFVNLPLSKVKLGNGEECLELDMWNIIQLFKIYEVKYDRWVEGFILAFYIGHSSTKVF